MPSAYACLFSKNTKITIFIPPIDTQYFVIIWCKITEGNVLELLLSLLSYCMIKPLNIWLFRH